jgi:hypothetical protein
MMRDVLRYGIVSAVVAMGWAGGPAVVDALAQGGGNAAPTQAQVPTLRTPDGRPDLTGRWVRGGGGGPFGGAGVTVITADGKVVKYANIADVPPGDISRIKARIYGGRRGNPTYGERDAGMEQRLFSNPPIYKPEFWERVEYLDMHGNYEDSNFRCLPAGVPRVGPPTRIVQAPTAVFFMYQNGNLYRMIPTDGRPHDPINSKDQTYMGDSIGRWEGDTLVVDVVGFNEETWLGWPGWFHTTNMRVVERLHREGTLLQYQATVHDPDVLQEPWVVAPVVLRLDTAGRVDIESPPCVPDERPMVSRERG